MLRSVLIVIAALTITALPGTSPRAGDGNPHDTRLRQSRQIPVQGEEHYATRDGLRIYLWNKHRGDSKGTLRSSGRVVLLVHGSTWSGRPAFDLQIRDYSLMDFLAQHDYDVWAIDIHGYGHSDKPDQNWSGMQSAADDIASAVTYIAKLRGVSKVDLLGWSAGTQRAGLYAMQHPDSVGKLILYAPCWQATAQFREQLHKRIENGGQPLPAYRTNTEQAARSDFVEGELAAHPQYEEDVAAAFAQQALKTDPRSPNSFVDFGKLPWLDPHKITVPTLIIFGEYDYFANQEDLLPFFAQLKTSDKQFVMLPHGGHAVMLEKDHRRFQQDVLSFLDRP